MNTANLSPVTAFDPHTAKQEQVLAVAGLWAECFSFANPDELPYTPEILAIEITKQLSTSRSHHFVIWNDQQAIGWGSLSSDIQQNTHLGDIRLYIHPEFRRKGLAKLILANLVETARKFKNTHLLGNTSSTSPAGEAFAEYLNAKPALSIKLSRLLFTDVDWDLMHKWQQRPEGDPYKLHLWNTVPAEYLERMAELVMIMNTAPKGEIEMEDSIMTPQKLREIEQQYQESGELLWIAAIEHVPTGHLHGYTTLISNEDRPLELHQEDTGVKIEARGRGLGKWVKAAMLEHVHQALPKAERIITGNANANDAMLGINTKMGFHFYRQTIEWQIEVKDLS